MLRVGNMVSANDKYINTKSSKYRRVVPLKNYIINAIDSNQEIKRLARYYTKTPLLNKGEDYSGVKINQPDLIDSLTKPVVKDTSVSSTAKGRILYNYAFSDDVIAERQVSIFVHCPSTVYNNNAVTGRVNYGLDIIGGQHFFKVDIAYPIEFNDLNSLHSERANEIANLIIDEIDGMVVEGDIAEFTGQCQLRVEGDITDLRLSVSDYMVLTIPVHAYAFGVRVDKSELGGDMQY